MVGYKLEEIELVNYAPFVAIGLSVLYIDFRETDNVLTLVMGPNGTGKTFLLNEITPLPLERVENRGHYRIEQGKEGKKKLVYLLTDSENIPIARYECLIIFPADGKAPNCRLIKEDITTGDREDLCPNGNVRTYVELVEQHLGMGKNHSNIGFLTSSMTDIIKMKPTERNNYMTTWQQNLDDYLEGYKIVMKAFNSNKKHVGVLNKEIGEITSDEIRIEQKQLRSQVDSLENSLNEINRVINHGELYFQKIEPYLRIIDSNKINSDLEKVRRNQRGLLTKRDSLQEQYLEISKYIGDEGKELLTRDISQLNYRLDTMTNNMKELDKQLIDLSMRIGQLQTSIEKLDIDDSEYNSQNIYYALDNMKKEIDSMYQMLEEMVKNDPFLSDRPEDFDKSAHISFHSLIESLVDHYDKISTYVPIDTISNIDKRLVAIEEEYKMNENVLKLIEDEIGPLAKRIYALENKAIDDSILSLRPQKCPLTCPLYVAVQNYLAPDGEVVSLKEQHADLARKRVKLESQQESLTDEIGNYRVALSYLEDINHRLKRDEHLIANCPKVFYETLKDNDLYTIFSKINIMFTYSKKFKEFLHLLERYNDFQERYNKLQDKEKIFSIKDSSHKEISNLQSQYNDIRSQRESIVKEMTNVDERLDKLKNIEVVVKNLTVQSSELNSDINSFNENKRRLEGWIKVWYYGNHLSNILRDKERERSINNDRLRTIRREIELNESKLLTKETLEKDRDILLKDMEKYKTLMETWSPKEGIPAIFIQAFLEGVKRKANEYLLKLWGEGLSIHRFEVNAREFLIKIRKDDILLEDASVCSDGQKAILSVAISLAVMEEGTKGQKYNLLRFDEMDSALDDSKRKTYMELIKEQIEEIGVKSCFVITHNDEFENVKANVILLPGATIPPSMLDNKHLLFAG